MKINNIYAGSWVPRTTLHLDEFYHFLSEGKSHLNLNDKELKALNANLNIHDLKLSENGQMIVAKMDKLDFKYYEDGLIITCKQVTDLKKDFKYLGDFSVNNLFKAFSYVYSVGAPIPKIFTAIFSVLPFIVTVSEAKPSDVEKLFLTKNEKIHKVINGDNEQIYFGEELIVINSQKDDLELIKNLIFIEDCRSQFNKILNLHRFIWEEVDKIKHQKKLPYNNLPITRDTLMELNNEVLFLSSRLSQIKFLLAGKKDLINILSNKKIKEYLNDNFYSLEQTGGYLSDLWTMTESHVRSTQELITSLYQESTQKQLNILQIIFIVSAVASIIALGSIYGFDFKAYDGAGNLMAYGSTVSFTFFDLARFGFSALGLGLSIYVIFFFVYNKISYSKISSGDSLQDKELRNIKKMFR
ncbi:MAG: hypothetical protein WCJ57_00070 [Candidatus Falkowbacteria bacterium]